MKGGYFSLFLDGFDFFRGVMLFFPGESTPGLDAYATPGETAIVLYAEELLDTFDKRMLRLCTFFTVDCAEDAEEGER